MFCLCVTILRCKGLVGTCPVGLQTLLDPKTRSAEGNWCSIGLGYIDVDDLGILVEVMKCYLKIL